MIYCAIIAFFLCFVFIFYISRHSWEFYDLQEDPKENHNAYGEKRYASIIKEMKKEMMRLRKEVKDTDEGSARMWEILKNEGL